MYRWKRFYTVIIQRIIIFTCQGNLGNVFYKIYFKSFICLLWHMIIFITIYVLKLIKNTFGWMRFFAFIFLASWNIPYRNIFPERTKNQVLRWDPGKWQNCMGARWRFLMYSFKFCLLIALPSLWYISYKHRHSP